MQICFKKQIESSEKLTSEDQKFKTLENLRYLGTHGRQVKLLTAQPPSQEKRGILVLNRHPGIEVSRHQNFSKTGRYQKPGKKVHFEINNLSLAEYNIFISEFNPRLKANALHPFTEVDVPLKQELLAGQKVIDPKLHERLIVSPSSAYVYGDISLKEHNHPVQIDNLKPTKIHNQRLLIDTGCMVSTISLHFYNKLNNNSKTVRYMPCEMTMKSANKNKDPIFGMAKVCIDFHNGLEIYVTVLIVENLTNNFILGYDVLGHDDMTSMTNEHLTFNMGNNQVKKVPIEKHYYKPQASYSMTDVIIGSLQTHLVPFRVQDIDILKDKVEFAIFKSKIKSLDVLPTVYVYNKGKKNNFLLPVFNNSENDVIIDKDTCIASIDFCDREFKKPQVIDINSMHLYDDIDSYESDNESVSDLNINSVFVDGKKVISSQNSLSAEEKIRTFKELEKEGYFKQSVTDYIKNKSTITELSLIDDKVISDQEFLSQFNLDNLKGKHKNLAQKIFLKNKEAFAMHQYDIGKTNLVEMNINAKNKQPRPQKYIPIPLNAKEKVKEILDQLEKYDIIQKCDEPSNYCSNILVIKRKDGRIRLLFDGRILNFDTDRLPMSTVSKPEIISHLVGKKHLTSLDFADAFFHIPLDKESQPLTAFYSSVHGHRYCFNRAPMGLRNSPLYLKIMLDKVFHDMSDSCILFFDDLLIATDGTLQEHLEVVDQALQRIIDAGLKLRPKKLSLAKEHVEFL